MKKILLAIVFTSISCLSAAAIESIQVEKQYGVTIPVSLCSIGQDEEDKEILKTHAQVAEIVGNDFKTTVDIEYKGLNNYQTDSKILDLKKYDYYGSKFVVNINVVPKPSDTGTFIVEAKIYDVKNEIILAEKRYAFKHDTIRKVSHVIADLAYYAITGKMGYFQSKILFSSSDAVKTKNSKKSIYMIDQDGFGEKVILEGGLLANPMMLGDNASMAYVDLEKGEPKLKAINIFNHSKVNLETLYPKLDSSKYHSTPSLCSQGDCLLVTRLYGEGSDIYKMTRSGSDLIASGRINTSPSPAPDGKRIVFESNADGRRNLYIKSTSGLGQAKFLTGNDGIYAEPRWSFDGEWIAFTKLRNGLFHLGIIRPDGTEEEILYSSYMLENPYWMPNSDAILVSEKRNKLAKSTILMIDLTGRVVRSIPTSVGAVAPYVWIIR